ncbi:MAG: hypothetical protein IJ083_10145 [Clostridia bacterium]|nr:hypothetical protein [Clostridia bacterium]
MDAHVSIERFLGWPRIRHFVKPGIFAALMALIGIPLEALCYAGTLVFLAGMLAPAVSGQTELPVWEIELDLLPLHLVQAWLRIPGAENSAGTVAFEGLLFLVWERYWEEMACHSHTNC